VCLVQRAQWAPKARKVQKEFERVTGGDYEALRQIIAQAIINTIPTG